MKLVIEIPEEEYIKVKDGRASVSMMRDAIRNGTPLPKGHGRLIDADELEARLRMQPNNMSKISVIDMVHASPTIEERKSGRLVIKRTKEIHVIFPHCSCCDWYSYNWVKHPFCPNCGAEMEGSEEE